MKYNLVANIFLILFVLLSSCKLASNDSNLDQELVSISGDQKFLITHAIGFSVDYIDGYKIVKLERPWQGSNQALTYVLRQVGTPINDSIAQLGTEVIVPLESIVCNSTSHLSLLEALGLESKLKGFAQTKYIYSENIMGLVKSNDVAEVGIEAQMNFEKILEINPDAVMAFSAGQENKQLNNLSELGIKVIMNADYLETNLLGRAEWIKFVALFFNKEKEADSIFNELHSRYDSLIDLVQVAERPNVLSGSVYGSTWFMPAGKNYNAQLIENAGGNYLWNENSDSGWLNLDFELVYEKASLADIWIGVADFQSLNQMKNADIRYADFKAFKQGRVYTYIGRTNESDANDYFESGNINPDLILADHIKILHPELLPDYKLYYYKKLE